MSHESRLSLHSPKFIGAVKTIRMRSRMNLRSVGTLFVVILLNFNVCLAARELKNAPTRLQFEHWKMQELVEEAGYPLEEHFVTTEDGYVLGVYRIPHGRNQTPQLSTKQPTSPQNKPPVILQHGLLDCSATWVLNLAEHSLGFILADQGYDVWLSNSRGNAFSRNHTGISVDTPAFWDFTWQDMADYDVPAVVKYVKTHTGFSKVAYVGHSQGNTIALAALATNDWLRNSLSVFVALAPAAYVRYVTSLPMITLAQLQADQIFNLVGSHEFLPARKETADIFHQICITTPLLCTSIMTAITGFNPNNLNLTRLPTYVEYAPSGTSVKNMAHWAQMVRQSWEASQPIFRKYDYGGSCFTSSGYPRMCNRRVYDTDEPPSYDLSRIQGVPIAVFSGVQDRLADPVDVEMLLEALPSDWVVYTHTELGFEHLDFTWGSSAAELIYPKVLEVLEKYGGGQRQEEEKLERGFHTV